MKLSEIKAEAEAVMSDDDGCKLSRTILALVEIAEAAVDACGQWANLVEKGLNFLGLKHRTWSLAVERTRAAIVKLEAL